MAILSAWVFSGLSLIVAMFQFGVAAGRPWGHLTNGGKFPGQLPMAMRGLAAVFGILWVVMAMLILGHVRGLDPSGPVELIPITALVAVTTVLNLITPSRPERLLWGPVTVLMLISLLVIWFA